MDIIFRTTHGMYFSAFSYKTPARVFLILSEWLRIPGKYRSLFFLLQETMLNNQYKCPLSINRYANLGHPFGVNPDSCCFKLPATKSSKTIVILTVPPLVCSMVYLNRNAMYILTSVFHYLEHHIDNFLF